MELLSLVSLIILQYVTHYSGVLCKFDKGLEGLDGGAVVWEDYGERAGF